MASLGTLLVAVARADLWMFPRGLSSYCSHVTPSTPGAAFFLISRNASRSRSTVMWCKSALNRSFLSPERCLSHTFQRTWHTLFPALCPGRVLLVRVLLGQPPSLHRLRRGWSPALFGGFVGTMGLSDFPCPCIAGLRSSTFPARPSGPSPRGRTRDLPVLAHGVSTRARRSPTAQGRPAHSPWRTRPCCLPLRTTASAPWLHLFSRLNTPPVCAPVNASPAPSRGPTHDSGSPWLARPSV